MRISIKVTKNCLPAIAGKVGPTAKRGLADTLNGMRDLARSRARVDTGRMRAQTQVVGGITLRAGAPYSGYLNYGTSRGIAADYWFSGAVEQEAANIGQTLGSELEAVMQCG